MNMRAITVFAATAALTGLAGAADYDESVDGDLASVADGGTSFNLDLGVNSVAGTLEANPAGGIEEDFITFTVGAGQAINSVTLTDIVFTGGNFSTGFRLYADIGAGLEQVSSGSFGAGAIGVNYLTVWDLTDVGGGPSLGAGSYGIVLAEFTPGQQYVFDITVVPTPGAAAVLGLGGLAAIRRRR